MTGERQGQKKKENEKWKRCEEQYLRRDKGDE